MMALRNEDERVTGEGPRRRYRRIVLGFALGLALLFAGGVAIGAALALIDGDAGSPALLVAALAFAFLAGRGLVGLKVLTADEKPVGPRTRKAQQMLVLTAVIGVLLGVILSIGILSVGGPGAIFSSTRIPAGFAAGALAIWLIVVPTISWIWFRSIDEHEVAAYNFGAVVAVHLYLVALPAWWVAWRGGFLPEPQHGTLFVAVTLAWCLGWAWRRYR